MNNSSRVSSSSLTKQRGFVFKLIHSLLIVVAVVGVVMLYRAGKLPFINYHPNLQGWNISNYSGNPNSWNNNSSDLWEPPSFGSNGNNYIQARQRQTVPVVREREGTQYTTNRYAVQVAAGYDSRQLYSWRDELARDGYDAYLVSLNTPRGLMFKLRVGTYRSRSQAEKLQTTLRNRYPINFGGSFVVEGD